MKKLWYRIRARLGFPHPDSLAYQIKYRKPGETIFIKPGTYTENVKLKDGLSIFVPEEEKYEKK